MKDASSHADKKRMAVHVICPSLRCRKILTLADEVRGKNVTCRYCQMQFRVPQLRRAADAPSATTAAATTTKTPAKPAPTAATTATAAKPSPR